MTSNIKTICAWCNKTISEANDDNATISHGICEDCYSSLLSSTKKELKTILDKLSAPIIVVEESGRALYANTTAEKIIDKKNTEISGMLGGDIFECIHSKEPGGCGETIHCKYCTIRNSVEHTFATGESLVDIPATLKIKPDATIKDATSLITTIRKQVAQDEYIVCLTINDFNIDL